MCWNPATDTSLKFTIAYVDANCGSSCCTFFSFFGRLMHIIWCRVVRSRDVHFWCRDVRSRVFHSCDLMPRCQVSRCPHLLYNTTLSSSAMSVPAILMVSRFQSLRLYRVGQNVTPVGIWISALYLLLLYIQISLSLSDVVAHMLMWMSFVLCK